LLPQPDTTAQKMRMEATRIPKLLAFIGFNPNWFQEEIVDDGLDQACGWLGSSMA